MKSLLALVIAVVSTPGGSPSIAFQDKKTSNADLVARLRTDRMPGEALKLVSALPGNGPIEIISEAWPGMDVGKKRQTIYACLEIKSPATIRVFDLCAHDSDLAVQNEGYRMLSYFSIVPLADDYHFALKWLEANGRRPYEPVKAELDRELETRLLEAKDPGLTDLAVRLDTLYPYPMFDQPKWPRSDRKRVFKHLMQESQSMEHSPTDRGYLQRAALAVGLDDADMPTDLAPLWYRSRNSELCTKIIELLQKSNTEWARKELRSEFEYCLKHPHDRIRFDTLSLLADPSNIEIVPMAIHAIESGPPARTSQIGYSILCNDLTGLTFDARRDNKWWADWWKRNHRRYENGPYPISTPQQDKASETVATNIMTSKPEDVPARLKAEWDQLTRKGKQRFVLEVRSHQPANEIALLETALNDRDPIVQSTAMTVLSALALKPMSEDYESAESWTAAHRQMSWQDCRKESSRVLLSRLLNLQPSDAVAEIEANWNLYTAEWVPSEWSEGDREHLYRYLFQGLEAYGKDSNGTVDLMRNMNVSSAFIEKLLSPTFSHLTDQTMCEYSLQLIENVKEDWATHAVLNIIRLAVAKPDGDAAQLLIAAMPANSMRISLGLSKKSVEELVPELIRAIMLGPDSWKYYLDYFSLAGLTKVPYDELHSRKWWSDWWKEHKSQYGDSANFEMPAVPAESKDDSARLQPPDIRDDEPFRSVAAKYVAFVEKGGVFTNFYDRVAEKLKEKDQAQSVPYFISTILGTGDEKTYEITTRYLSDAAGIGVCSKLRSDWWKKWWENNSPRFPDFPKQLPKIKLFTPNPAPKSPLLGELKKVASKVTSLILSLNSIL